MPDDSTPTPTRPSETDADAEALLARLRAAVGTPSAALVRQISAWPAPSGGSVHPACVPRAEADSA